MLIKHLTLLRCVQNVEILSTFIFIITMTCSSNADCLDGTEFYPSRSHRSTPLNSRIATENRNSGTGIITLIESIETILNATQIKQEYLKPLTSECFTQLRNKWAYRVSQQHPPLPRKRIPHPTGVTREFSTLPVDVVDEFMPVWVAWALRRIELDLRNEAIEIARRAEEIARYLAELNIDDDAMEAVGQEAEANDDDPE